MVDAMRALQRAPVFGINAVGDLKSFIEHAKLQAGWHAALIKVTEFLEAQACMGHFNDDPHAKHIFEQIVIRGIHDVINNSRGPR